MNIGIVGQGFVGSAIREGLRSFYTLHTFDIAKAEDFATDTIDELVKNSDIIFVCLPTPMRPSGECDTRILEKAVLEIDDLSNRINSGKKIIIIKSTVPPGTTHNLDTETSQNCDVIFSPEFLTEANAFDDFKNQNRIIIGGKRPATTKLRQIYSLVFPNVPIIKTGSKTAEMVKYFTNTFLATKVSFANEMNLICDKLGIDYDKVVEYSIYDERLGKSHWAVPGPDGHYGFGGSCFPKDINALIKVAEKMDIPPNILSAAWDTNTLVRPEQDWKELKGRAVVNE